MKKALILLFAVCVSLSACTNNVSNSDETTENQTSQTAISEITTKVNSQAERLAEMEKLNEISKNEFTVGDTKAIVTLATDAEKDENGEFMWDDGHIFALEVNIDNNYSYLFKPERIQLGDISYKAFENYNNNSFNIITNYFASSGIITKHFEYKADEKAFYERNILNYDNINVLN